METAVARSPLPAKHTSPPRPAWSKVPEVTLYFWLIKVLCTTVGETVSDDLNATLGLGIDKTALLMGALLVGSLVLQLRAKKYVPTLYWAVVVLVSIVGTLLTDKLTDDYGVPLEVTTLVFAVVLAAVFWAWYKVEGSLSIRTITTPRREGFYWGAILATFALGTAAGDYLLELLADLTGRLPAPPGADEGGAAHPQAALLVSAGLFAAVIAVAALGHVALKWNAVLMFWIAYIFTRPLGANLGDLFSLGPDDGGIGLGPALTSGIFLAAIVACVAYLTLTKKDTAPDPHFVVETKAERAAEGKR